ncbi:MAG: F0F1 ATP synthase subunit A [Acidobacteria bacterium]|jgi:F-type H+-transporting ATPase subunit a|nr:MAG: F0F1 ATP synthase subunit A [Acidobacteriota bacterium]
MHEQAAWLTEFVNHHLGHVALALLAALHIQPSHPELPIPQRVVMAVVVVIIGTIFALVLRSRLSVEKPGAMQQVAEMLLTNPMRFGIKDLLEENVHHGASQFVPFVGTISVFVLLGNLMGAFPSSFLTAPTSDPTVPLACAVLTFVYFNWQGARRHGVAGYLLTFAGSPKDFGAWILAILLFPVEVVSTTARILSLTVRLWANMFASDLIYLIFVGLLAGGASFGWGKSPVLGVVLAVFPATIPVLFIGLHVFVSVIQAYVFTVLPAVYLGLATAEEH